MGDLFGFLRGTYINLEDHLHLLYTRGSVEFFNVYPGMYVPHPLRFRSDHLSQSAIFAAQELLALTKMNWNNTQFDGLEPITIRAARQVGSILKYIDDPRLPYRRRLMKKVQEIAKRRVIPWLRPEQEEAEQQYRRVSPRFVEMGNDFLKKLAEEGIPELARMPHALDPEVGFRVRSTFTFADYIQVAQPVSPLRWLADVFLSFIGALYFIKNDGREFLVTLLEVNSTRLQSDILNRIQESHGRLDVEIRKLLHEVSRVAEQALSNARRVREEGASEVEAALERLGTLEREIVTLGDSASLPCPVRLPQ